VPASPQRHVEYSVVFVVGQAGLSQMMPSTYALLGLALAASGLHRSCLDACLGLLSLPQQVGRPILRSHPAGRRRDEVRLAAQAGTIESPDSSKVVCRHPLNW
jgi:hypothetical protein